MEFKVVVGLHLADQTSLVVEFGVGVLNRLRLLPNVFLQKYRTVLSHQQFVVNVFQQFVPFIKQINVLVQYFIHKPSPKQAFQLILQHYIFILLSQFYFSTPPLFLFKSEENCLIVLLVWKILRFAPLSPPQVHLFQVLGVLFCKTPPPPWFQTIFH